MAGLHPPPGERLTSSVFETVVRPDGGINLDAEATSVTENLAPGEMIQPWSRQTRVGRQAMVRTATSIAIVVFIACDTSIQPTRPRQTGATTFLLPPVCRPVDIEIHCAATGVINGQRMGMTNLVTWSVADSALSDGLTPSSAAVISAPGIVTPLRPGIVAVHARYPNVGHSVAHYTYAVDPSSPPVVLAPHLTGFVSEADGQTAVAGALVEILAGGPETGKTDTTRVNGYYFIQHVRMGIPMTVRASKAGYESVVSSHPGIVDSPSGHPEGNFLHFRLHRVP